MQLNSPRAELIRFKSGDVELTGRADRKPRRQKGQIVLILNQADSSRPNRRRASRQLCRWRAERAAARAGRLPSRHVRSEPRLRRGDGGVGEPRRHGGAAAAAVDAGCDAGRAFLARRPISQATAALSADPIFPLPLRHISSAGRRWTCPGASSCPASRSTRSPRRGGRGGAVWVRAGRRLPSHTHEGVEVTLLLKAASPTRSAITAAATSPSPMRRSTIRRWPTPTRIAVLRRDRCAAAADRPGDAAAAQGVPSLARPSWCARPEPFRDEDPRPCSG